LAVETGLGADCCFEGVEGVEGEAAAWLPEDDVVAVDEGVWVAGAEAEAETVAADEAAGWIGCGVVVAGVCAGGVALVVFFWAAAAKLMGVVPDDGGWVEFLFIIGDRLVHNPRGMELQ